MIPKEDNLIKVVFCKATVTFIIKILVIFFIVKCIVQFYLIVSDVELYNVI